MDLSELKGIINLMQKSDLTELEIELQDLKLRMARPGLEKVYTEPLIQTRPPTQTVESTPSTTSKKDDGPSQNGVDLFKSPMVGTFYRKPSPDDPPFVEIGKKISSGEVLCIIEAMKVMNEIQSETAGEVIEILVEDGESVEYGQPLFKIGKG